MRRGIVAFVTAALLAGNPAARAADVLYDNLGKPTDGVEQVSGGYWVAGSFGTDSSTYALTRITLPVALQLGDAEEVVLDVYSSAPAGTTGVPDEPIGTLTATTTIPGIQTDVAFTAAGIILSPATTYWVVMHTTSSNTFVLWAWTFDDTGAGAGFQHNWGFSNSGGAIWSMFDTAPMLMRVEAEKLDPWVDLGFALAGGSGPPQLGGVGTLQPGSAGSLQLSAALPFAPAVLFVSTSSAPSPFKGGTLAPVPVLAALPIVPGAPGGDVVSWSAWPGGFSGVILVLQAAIADPGAVKGVALSNALGVAMP